MVDSNHLVSDAIIDAIDAGIILLDCDARVLRWNSWMIMASGISAQDAAGRSLAELFSESQLHRLTAATALALDSGLSSILTYAIHKELLPLKTRAGRALLHDVRISPVRSQPTACLLHISDVTMSIRRELFLRRRQNARYDAVVESAPDVILTLDGDEVIRFANPAATAKFGYAAHELIGQNASILFDTQGAWKGMWNTTLDAQQSGKPVELIVCRKDGSNSYVEVSASRWQDESFVFITAILRDINERRVAEEALRTSEAQLREIAIDLADLNATLEQRVQERTTQLMTAEEALRQSHKMEAIGQLTGGIAHDFNNLLQGIVGALDMVQKRISEGHLNEVDRFLNGALSSAQRASALTHRLLAFSRRQPVDPRPVGINYLIGTMEELLCRSIGEKIKMNIVGAADLKLVRCDANQLENALLNLVINARDAMPDGGVLTIATCNKYIDVQQAAKSDVKAGDYVSLSVVDNGVGMLPDVQARAFDPFYTTKPIGQGTGLGLSMIYGFVRQSNGFVRIQSSPGKGTTVEIGMPVFDGVLESGSSDAIDIAPIIAVNNEVILVAEDEEIVRMLVVEVLKDLGYQVLEAGDGPSALKILQSSQRVDLLITDIGLPDINGRQVADAARIKRPDLKILFMTGYAESAASSEFLEKGMQIISKPFTMAGFAAKIKNSMENSLN